MLHGSLEPVPYDQAIMADPVDFEWLEGSVLRPSRITAGSAALPTDPRRGFRATVLTPCPRCRGSGTVGTYTGSPDEWEEGWTCGDCGTLGVLAADTPIVDQPPGPEAAAALTRDPDGLLRAERLARTCVRHLALWDVPASDRIIWRVGGPLTEPMRATLPHPRTEIIRRLFFGHWNLKHGTHAGAFTDPGYRQTFINRAMWHAKLDHCWRLAAERSLIVPGSFNNVGIVDLSDRPGVIGHSMADLPNPFGPLVELWATGYAFADVTSDGIHLIAPEPT